MTAVFYLKKILKKFEFDKEFIFFLNLLTRPGTYCERGVHRLYVTSDLEFRTNGSNVSNLLSRIVHDLSTYTHTSKPLKKHVKYENYSQSE